MSSHIIKVLVPPTVAAPRGAQWAAAAVVWVARAFAAAVAWVARAWFVRHPGGGR